MTTNFQARILIVVALVGCAAVALLAALISHEGAAEAATKPTHHYAVLARSATAADHDRAGQWRVTPQMMAESQPSLGIDAAAGRLVHETASEAVQAMPTRSGGVCLAQAVETGDEGLACSTTDNPSTALIGYGKAVGIVPDGVTEVTFHLTSGADVGQQVSDNLFVAPANAESVTFSIDGRTQQQELMPAGSKPEGAVTHADGTISLGP